MKTYKDLTKNKESKWFQMNPLLGDNHFIGIDREDGKTSVSLEPGDLIELTPMELYANQDRPCFKDGMVAEVPAHKVKEALAMKHESPITTEDNSWAACDPVEFINKASAIKSRSILKTLLEKAKQQNRPYQTIKALEEMIEKAAGV